MHYISLSFWDLQRLWKPEAVIRKAVRDWAAGQLNKAYNQLTASCDLRFDRKSYSKMQPFQC